MSDCILIHYTEDEVIAISLRKANREIADLINQGRYDEALLRNHRILQFIAQRVSTG